MFYFDHEPTFAELWEMCVYKLLYSEKGYCDDIENLFVSHGISKQSRILDVSAGSGFPALGLIEKGYSIDCADGFRDEVELFNKRAAKRGLPVSCKEVLWAGMQKEYAPASYDFLFCRGNSFIYALGGWNTEVAIDPHTALAEYSATAKIFFDLLKPGGYLFIDKFKDSETTHKATVAQISVNGSEEDLIFWTERFPEQKLRRASMLRRKADGTETGIPNVSYDLTVPDLAEALSSAGFKNLKRHLMPSEKEFDVFMVQKPD